MNTLDTMEDSTIEARLLDALETLNGRMLVIERRTFKKSVSRPATVSHFRVRHYPMAAEWLRKAGFDDIDLNRWTYYGLMEELVTRNLVEAVTRTHGTACLWRRFYVNNAGRDLLTIYRAANAI